MRLGLVPSPWHVVVDEKPGGPPLDPNMFQVMLYVRWAMSPPRYDSLRDFMDRDPGRYQREMADARRGAA